MRKFRPTRLPVLGAVVFLLCLVLVACASGSSTPQNTSTETGAATQTLRIYTSLPMSGSNQAQSQSLINAMQMALADTTNNTSEIGNFKIEFVPLDDSLPTTGQYDANQETANATKAATDPDAMLYLGPLTSVGAETAIPILNKAGIAMVSPGTTYPGLTKAVPGITQLNEPTKYYPTGAHNFFRLVPTDELQGRADASYTAAKLHSQRVYVVDDGSDYGAGLAHAYEQSSQYYNLSEVGYATLTASNLNALVGIIKDANTQVVFYGGISKPAAQLYNALGAAGLKITFFGGNGIQDNTFLQQVGNPTNRIYSSVNGTDSSGLTAKGQTFLNAFKAKYGDTVQTNTIYGYDAMNVALEAIRRANQKDRTAILKAVASTQNFDGASGHLSFDQNGDTNQSVFTFYSDRGQNWVFDSIANTSTNSEASTSTDQNGPPTVLATSKNNSAAPSVPSSPGVNPAPSNTPVTGKRVDAGSRLPSAFQLQKLADLPVAVYIPPDTTGGSQPLQVLFVLHGMFDNGGRFAAPLIPFAQQNHLILLAPTFNYNVNYKDPNVIASEDLKLSAQLNQILGQFDSLNHLPVNSKVLLFGFSRGAQLVHHYAELYPAQVAGAVALSGGAYTLPLTQIHGQTINFPFGIADFYNYAHENFDQTDFAKIPFDVQVGALDNDPSQVSRAWDNYIGVSRLARGQNFYNALLQDGVKAQFHIIPNTSHEVNKGQLTSAETFLQGLLPNK